MKPRPAVFNEHEARAAAGLTMVAGAVAFAYAYFQKQYLPLQVVVSLFFVEFLIRVTLGLRYSPFDIPARALTRHRAPDWVSARPKRFAWWLVPRLQDPRPIGPVRLGKHRCAGDGVRRLRRRRRERTSGSPSARERGCCR